MKITQEQLDKISDLAKQIQAICPDADTSSINMWLTQISQPILTNKKVLIVDDDKDVVQAIEICMQEAGAKTSTAFGGNKAVEMAENGEYDLIILDMMLPQRSGFLVLQKIKGGKSVFQKPIVVMITGNPGARHQQYAEKLGVADYMLKPFTLEKLKARCENALEKAL